MLRLLVLLVLAGISQRTEGLALGDGVVTTPEADAATTVINECKEVPFEVVFVLDSSGSVGPQNFTVMKNFVKSVTDRLNIGDNGTHVGVITYSGYPSMRIHLTDYLDKASLDKAVDAIPYITGITETNMALDMLAGQGFIGARPGIARVGIVMTDGKSLHPNATAIAALNAQNQGINLFAVGIGPEINLDELSVIATDPDVQHIFRVVNFEALQNIVNMISTRTCKAKYIETSVTASPPLSTVTPAYINETKNATVECNETLADIVFILDTSGSVSEKNFQLMKQFVINIINDLDIGENQTKVGVITYSSYPVIGIKLGQFNSKLDLLNAVNRLNYYPGATATDAALDLARSEGFKGERPSAPNIAIVVTDGFSTQPPLTKIAAEGIKVDGTTVFSIGIGNEIDKDELNFISSDPDSEYVFFVANFTELSSIEKNVAKTTCEVPLNPVIVGTTQGPGVVTQGPQATGGTPELTPALVTQSPVATGITPTLSPKSTEGPAPGVTTQAFTGTTQEPCFAKIADVMFVVDSSGSVGPSSFEVVKSFIKQMIDVFDVSIDYTRVGVITFNIKSTIQFKLGQYNNATEIKQAIDKMIFTAGGTNTGEALENLRLNGFSNARAGVPNIAIVITDGLSMDPAVTKVQARILKDAGYTLIAIGVGNETNSAELQGIASVDQTTGKGMVYQVGSFDALKTLNTTVPTSACKVVAPTYIPTTTTEALSTTPCGDTLPNCNSYSRSVCSDYRPWAHSNCAAFCGFCEGIPVTQPPCVNNIPNCFEYGSYICETTSVARWARQNCPLYCHFCNESVVTAGTEQTVASTAISMRASTAKSSPTVSPASVSGEPSTQTTVATATPASGTANTVSAANTTSASVSPISLTGEPVTQATDATATPSKAATPSPASASTFEKPSPPTSASTQETPSPPPSAATVKVESPSPSTTAATPSPPTSGVTSVETPSPPSIATSEGTPSPPTSGATTTEAQSPSMSSATTVETPSPPTSGTTNVATPEPPSSAVTSVETPSPPTSSVTSIETPSPPSTAMTTAESPAPPTSASTTPETPALPTSTTTVKTESPSPSTVITTAETPAPPSSSTTVETPSPPTSATTLETPAPPISSSTTAETPAPPISSSTAVKTPSPPTSVSTGETPSPPTSSTTTESPSSSSPSSASETPIVSAASVSPTGEPVTVATQETASPASVSTQSTAGASSPGTETSAASVTASVTPTGEPTTAPQSLSNTTTGPVVTQPGQSTAGPTTAAPSSTVATKETTPQVTQTTASTSETCSSKVADLLFVIDSSGSVGPSSFENIKSFIKQSINVFDIGTEFTRIGVITYSTQPKLEFGLDTYNTSAAIINAIDGIQFAAGSTNTGGALEMLRSKGFLNERPGVPNIAIVITDGLSNDPSATGQQARLAKESGNMLIAIGVGNQTDQVELEKIASKDRDTGKGMVFKVTSYADLKTVQETVIKYACNVAKATNPPPTTAATTPGPVNTTQPAPESCVDTISNCRDYGRGVCFDYQPWANAHCPRFCGFCQPSGNVTTTPRPCVDNINNCQEYGTYICTSSSLASWTEKNCYKYCGLCPGGSVPTEPPTTPAIPEPVDCSDVLPNCAEYGGKSVCTNEAYRPWARKNCRKYCGFCVIYEVKPGLTLPNNQTCPEWLLPSECTLVQNSDDCCPLPQCPDGYKLTVKLPNED